MTTTNESTSAERASPVTEELLKTDVLGRVKVGSEKREAVLDVFDASGMSAQAFARQHGINAQTFASWVQKRRHQRGAYQNPELRRQLRMPHNASAKKAASSAPVPSALNLIEVQISSESRSACVQPPIEVVLPHGIVIRVSCASQIGLLQTLMREVRC